MMTRKDFEEMEPTAVLNLWAEMHRPSGRESFAEMVSGVGPAGYRVQSFAPPSVPIPNELAVAIWVHMTIRPWGKLLDYLFADGECVADVEASMGERIVRIYLEGERWSYDRRARFERAIGIKCEGPRSFGLAVVAAAEAAIAEKREKYPPILSDNLPDPDVVAAFRRDQRAKRRAEMERVRYHARKR